MTAMEEKSCLTTVTKAFTLESYGKNRKEAMGNIFAKFKKVVYTETPGLIIHMEPEDVLLLEQTEKTTTQKLMGYFAPKEIRNYYIKVKIVAKVKYIPD